MLKKTLFASAALALVAALAGCAKAPPPQDVAADTAKLKADALTWFGYCEKGDAEGMANLYAEDAQVMAPGAPTVIGRAAIREFLGKEAAGLKAAGLVIKNGTVTGAGVNGDLGWISGNYTVADAKGTVVDSGNYLSVHRRANGAWLYIRDTWNSDRPSAAAPASAPAASAPAPKK